MEPTPATAQRLLLPVAAPEVSSAKSCQAAKPKDQGPWYLPKRASAILAGVLVLVALAKVLIITRAVDANQRLDIADVG